MADKMTHVYDLRQFVNQQTANLNHCTYFAVDTSALQDKDSEIVDALAAFAAMYPKARLIVVRIGGDSTDKLALDLKALGACFIIGKKPADQQKEIAAAFAGPQPPEPATVPPPEIKTVVREVIKEVPVQQTVVKEVIREVPVEKLVVKRLKQHVTVSVCGTGARVGATTQALHIVKYLTGKGARACYVDFADSGNIMAHHKIYGGSLNEQSGYLSYGGADMFYKPNLPLIVSMGYEFIVMDFGVFGLPIPQGFITADVRVAVSGVKPLEMGGLAGLFNAVDILDGVQFIFSFAPESDHAYILEQMDTLAGNTHFAPYAPSYFETGGDTGLYDKILGEYLQTGAPPPPHNTPPKKSLWKKLRE